VLSKKGQIEIPVITLIFVIIGLIIIAPFVAKMVNSVLNNFGSSIGNMSSEAGESVQFVRSTFIGFWDWVLLITFIINVILLFVSAFLVDTHPVFLILYIIIGVFTFSIAPAVKDLLDEIYNSANFAIEVSSLPIMDFIREYFGLILLGVFIISGIIMYSKIRGIGQQ